LLLLGGFLFFGGGSSGFLFAGRLFLGRAARLGAEDGVVAVAEPLLLREADTHDTHEGTSVKIFRTAARSFRASVIRRRPLVTSPKANRQLTQPVRRAP